MEPHPGFAIRAARRALGMRQAELAKCLGRSRAYVCVFELGRRDATPDEIALMRAVLTARQQAAERYWSAAESALAAWRSFAADLDLARRARA
jgi:transcriptional regulator with XRE-family HTH domain